MKKTRIFKIKRKQKLFIYSLILIYVDVISEGMLKIQWSSEWMNVWDLYAANTLSVYVKSVGGGVVD